MRRRVWRAIGGILIIGLAAVAIYVLGGFHQLGVLKDAALRLRSIDPRFLAAAVALDLISLLVNGTLWRRLLRCMGYQVPLRLSLSAYLSSGIAEYLANAAGAVVGTAVILGQRGIRPGRIVLITLLADALGFCGLLVWAPLGLLLFIRADLAIPLPVIGRHGVIALMILTGGLIVAMLVALRALALAPRARNALTKRLLGGTRVSGQPVPMRGLLSLIPWSAAGWLGSSLAFFVVLIGLHPAVAHRPIMVIGSLALAAILGNLAFFVPAGLGVRDGILITLLVHTAGVPVASAAITVVAMRALDPITKVGLLLTLTTGHGLRETSRSLRKAESLPPGRPSLVLGADGTPDATDVAAARTQASTRSQPAA
jgi:uncharacterized membrane protein YbhN (UPF0104 family)